MTHMGVKFAIAGGIMVIAVTYLAFAGMKTGWVYTLPVDQFVANVDQQKMRVRLCGTVSEKDLIVLKGQLTAKFTLKGEHTEVRVAYKGVVPDMFKAGSDVVVEGKRNDAGVFVCDVLMTKCASKYEARPAGHPNVASTTAATQENKVEVGLP